MIWERGQARLLTELSPEAAGFVRVALRRLEEENVFDAPGVISGVLRQMRLAESDEVRHSVPHAERLLKTTLGTFQRAGT